MTVGLLQLELSIPASRSLKDKRRVIKSVKDRIRARFNVSVAEVDDYRVWNRALVAVCCVSNDARLCNQILSKVVNLVESTHESELDDYRVEML